MSAEGSSRTNSWPRGVAAPARRALAAAGYRRLEDLDGVPVDELAALHGMGPRALDALRESLRERGLDLGD